MEELPGVTIVPKDVYNWKEIEDDTYDCVMSANTFSFVEYFWLTYKEMCRVVKPGGVIYIVTPSIRRDAKYPHYAGCWGFNTAGLIALGKYGNLDVREAAVAGVPSMKAGYEWDSCEDDAVLIGIKGESCLGAPDKNQLIERRWKNDHKKLPLRYYIPRRLEGIFHHYNGIYRG